MPHPCQTAESPFLKVVHQLFNVLSAFCLVCPSCLSVCLSVPLTNLHQLLAFHSLTCLTDHLTTLLPHLSYTTHPTTLVPSLAVLSRRPATPLHDSRFFLLSRPSFTFLITINCGDTSSAQASARVERHAAFHPVRRLYFPVRAFPPYARLPSATTSTISTPPPPPPPSTHGACSAEWRPSIWRRNATDTCVAKQSY